MYKGNVDTVCGHQIAGRASDNGLVIHSLGLLQPLYYSSGGVDWKRWSLLLPERGQSSGVPLDQRPLRRICWLLRAHFSAIWNPCWTFFWCHRDIQIQSQVTKSVLNSYERRIPKSQLHTPDVLGTFLDHLFRRERLFSRFGSWHEVQEPNGAWRCIAS